MRPDGVYGADHSKVSNVPKVCEFSETAKEALRSSAFLKRASSFDDRQRRVAFEIQFFKKKV